MGKEPGSIWHEAKPSTGNEAFVDSESEAKTAPSGENRFLQDLQDLRNQVAQSKSEDQAHAAMRQAALDKESDESLNRAYEEIVEAYKGGILRGVFHRPLGLTDMITHQRLLEPSAVQELFKDIGVNLESHRIYSMEGYLDILAKLETMKMMRGDEAVVLKGRYGPSYSGKTRIEGNEITISNTRAEYADDAIKSLIYQMHSNLQEQQEMIKKNKGGPPSPDR